MKNLLDFSVIYDLTLKNPIHGPKSCDFFLMHQHIQHALSVEELNLSQIAKQKPENSNRQPPAHSPPFFRCSKPIKSGSEGSQSKMQIDSVVHIYHKILYSEASCSSSQGKQ